MTEKEDLTIEKIKATIAKFKKLQRGGDNSKIVQALDEIIEKEVEDAVDNEAIPDKAAKNHSEDFSSIQT